MARGHQSADFADFLHGFLGDCVSSVGLMMNNPYEKVDITNIEVEVDIKQKNILSRIWSAKLSDSKVKAGNIITVEAVLESYLADKKKYQLEVKIPAGVKTGSQPALSPRSSASWSRP